MCQCWMTCLAFGESFEQFAPSASGPVAVRTESFLHCLSLIGAKHCSAPWTTPKAQINIKANVPSVFIGVVDQLSSTPLRRFFEALKETLIPSCRKPDFRGTDARHV